MNTHPPPYDLILGVDRADKKADLCLIQTATGQRWWAAAYYLQQRQKGCAHQTAVRALAYKWQRVIWRCWQDRQPYDEARYEAALHKAGSPLVALFGLVELGKSPWKNPVNKS